MMEEDFLADLVDGCPELKLKTDNFSPPQEKIWPDHEVMDENGALDIRMKLKEMAKNYGVLCIAQSWIEDQKFNDWSGSHAENMHHYGKHGLLLHTWEIMKICFSVKAIYPQYDIPEDELFLAVLFHDSGKTFDYEYAGSQRGWVSTQHKRRIHHITRSVLIWQQELNMYGDWMQERGNFNQVDVDRFKRLDDNVTHAILAHHGRREWGSPVAPNTRVAWLLHLADGMSARLYDCDNMDRLS